MTVDGALGRLGDHERLLWIAAVALYGVGDGLTTGVGLTAGGAAEVGPLVAPLVDRHGLAGLIGAKALTLAGFYGVWWALSTPGRVAVPFALATVGAAVTGWNASVLIVG